jgi:methylenetetrahydrofolate--tRNA-(uracil-5-)-methyltransferase
MRPHHRTAAHKTDDFGELVCSNSLKSEAEHSAPWQLKREMRRLGSLLLACADRARIPGGHALTVDRELFSRHITAAIKSHPRITIVREEMRAVPNSGIVIVATGPLTSDTLATDIARQTGADACFSTTASARSLLQTRSISRLPSGLRVGTNRSMAVTTI